MRKIRWCELCSQGEALHASYSSRPRAGSWEFHGHDFYEIFWIESGIGLHRLSPNRPDQRLISGQIYFVRASDFHGFSAEASNEPFACINIAFPSDTWAQLRERYSLATHPFFDESAKSPPVIETPPDLRSRFASLFQQALRSQPDALSRDAFLLDLAARTRGLEVPVSPENIPAWLQRGMMAFEHDPNLWRRGSSALADLCACSPTHLARVFRQHFNQRPTDWILDLRLVRASRLLASTGLSVTAISAESGFDNLSYFHRRFANRFSQTPNQYRRSHRREAL